MATPRVTLQSRNVRGKTVFHLDYRINGKRFRPKVGTSKRDAELIRAKVEREILLGTYQVSTAKKSIGLSGLIDEFLDIKKNSIRGTSLHRYKNYFDPLRLYFDKSFPSVTADVSLIETKYLRKFIDDAVQGKGLGGKKWSRRTGNDAIKIYRSLFKFAVDEGYISRNPADKVDPMRVPSTGKVDYFTDAELDLVWKTIHPHWMDSLKFILNTGLRKAELINLRWNAVNLTKGMEQITVESCDEWETKTGNSRIIPLIRKESKADIIMKRMFDDPKLHVNIEGRSTTIVESE
jgi:integrase